MSPAEMDSPMFTTARLWRAGPVPAPISSRWARAARLPSLSMATGTPYRSSSRERRSTLRQPSRGMNRMSPERSTTPWTATPTPTRP